VQLDADEYVSNFKGVTDFLKSKSSFLNNPSQRPVNYCFNFHVLYKKINGGDLYVKGRPEIYQVATNYPEYIACRRTAAVEISTGFDIVHHTWARTPEEVRMKLNNWTHAKDFNTGSYFKMWDAIDEENYKFIADFHPMHSDFWPKLDFLKGENVLEAIKTISASLVKKNTGLIQRLKANYTIKKWLARK